MGRMTGTIADYWTEKQAISDAHGELDEYIPVRAFRVLWRLLSKQGLQVTPENVAGLTAGQLLMQENFGRKSLVDVERWLACYGRRLGDRGKSCSDKGSNASFADALDVIHA